MGFRNARLRGWSAIRWSAWFGDFMPPLVHCLSELDALSQRCVWIDDSLTRDPPAINVTPFDHEAAGGDLFLPEVPPLG